MLNIYQEMLMNHYKNPTHRGILAHYDIYAEQRNSSCGDEIICTATIDNTIITDIRFDGKGCVISQATASLLSGRVIDMSLEYALSLDKKYLLDMIGIQLGPVRIQCALLSLYALQKGINEYISER